MDTFTHGLLGAAVARLVSKEKSNKIVLVGAVAAMAPDLDFLIQSSENPLLLIEYHRSFTHSLLFAPIGGFLMALLFWLIFKKRFSLKSLLLISTLCYLSHGLLDACTSYGTLLLWPFSHLRVSWDLIAIIDLFFSFALLSGLIISLVKKSKKPIIFSLLFISLYLSFGLFQNHRGLNLQRKLASSRHHQIEEGRLLPTLTNLFLWRSIYKSEGKIYADAFWIHPFGECVRWEGGSLPIFQPENVIRQHPILEKDLNLYDWFSDGFLVLLQEKPTQIGDLRYSLVPQGLQPLWGIEIDSEKQTPLLKRIRFHEDRSEMLKVFWKMLLLESSQERISFNDFLRK